MEQSNEFTRRDATSLVCPNCGATLKYVPDEGMFCCEYCAGKFSYQQMEEMRRREADARREDEAFDAQLQEYGCPACGASILTDNNTVAQFCAYCGNPVILKGRVTGQLKPQKIIPFAIGKDKAIEALRAYLAKRPFVPNDFKEQSSLEKITGVYHPFWMTDADTDCALDATGTQVSVWVSGNKRYTRTDYYKIWRRADIHFEDIATNALSNVDKVLIEGVLPYPIEAHRTFDMSYLSGFYAKRNDLSRDDVKAEVNARMRTYSEQLLRDTIRGYDTLKVERNAVIVDKSNWDYTLLPIWLLNYRYHGKIYTFAINGYTGKLFGDLPLSRLKLGLTCGGVALGIATVLSVLGGILL
jgi:DNA-directed RNA polymerase subunit RPC12/RpoP